MFHSSPAIRRALPSRIFSGTPFLSRRSPFHTGWSLQSGSKKPPAADRDSGKPTKAAASDGGSYARTDDSITVEYPSQGSLPPSRPISGAGLAGAKLFPTLASFSLKGRTAIVTGGARGLGLVMGQGIVVSGADLAIVDLNRMFFLG